MEYTSLKMILCGDNFIKKYHEGLKAYKNTDNTGIEAYKLTKGFISIRYKKNDSIYVYTKKDIGDEDFETITKIVDKFEHPNKYKNDTEIPTLNSFINNLRYKKGIKADEKLSYYSNERNFIDDLRKTSR